jgi:hypothetical protein
LDRLGSGRILRVLLLNGGSTSRALRTFGRTARRRMRNQVGRLPRPPACTRAARRSRCERSSDHGVEKRASAHLAAASSAKTAGFAVPVLYRSGAPGTIRTSDPKFVVCRLAPGTAVVARCFRPQHRRQVHTTVCWAYRHASNLRHPLGVDEPMKGDKSAKRVPQSVPTSFI